MDKNRKLIIERYKNSVKRNLEDISKILQSVGIEPKQYLSQYEEILNTSSGNIIDKWGRGKKYIRTEFVMKIFGDTYPREISRSSIMMDSMINILDDLFDENLTRDERKIFIIEYLRVFALYSMQTLSEKMQKSVGSYFNKLITLAIAENNILKQAESTNNMGKQIELSTKLLLVRARDIDIFIEIALDHKNMNSLTTLNCARYFRSLNLLKKDILDIDHDIKNDQQTLVTYVKSQRKLSFESYIRKIVEHFNDLFVSEGRNINKDSKLMYANLENMIHEESDQLLELAKKH